MILARAQVAAICARKNWLLLDCEPEEIAHGTIVVYYAHGAWRLSRIVGNTIEETNFFDEMRK